MTLKYLLDENVDKVYNRQFVQHNPNLTMGSIPNVQVISNPGYKLSLRAQRSGVKQSHVLRLLHYAVASFAMTNMFLQNWDAPLTMWVIGDPGAPPRGTLDPEILCWCEEYNFILVTNNRTSMPVHLAEHIAQERNIPGIFILNDKLTIGQTISELGLIAQASFNDEYQNQIINLPLL